MSEENKVSEIDQQFNKLKSVRVMIGTPMLDGSCTGQYKNAIVDLLCLFSKWNIGVRIYDVYGESIISKARNKIVDEFMSSSFDHEDDRLLFIDSDISFKAEDIVHMIILDKDVIAAPCTLKKINWERIRQAAAAGLPSWMLSRLGGDVIADFISEGGAVDEPVEVGKVGTGLLMIKRKVFERMRKELPEIRYILLPKERTNPFSDAAFAYFQSVIDSDPPNHFLTEDFYFSKNTRKLGMKIYLCMWMMTSHWGNHEYQMDILSIAEFMKRKESELEKEAVSSQR